MKIPERNGMLTELEYSKLLKAKDEKRAAIFKTVTKVNQVLIAEGRTANTEIHEGWKDVVCYFPYAANQDLILQVQAGPIPDNKRRLKIVIRELDKARWEEEKKLVSYGAEYQSVVRTILEPTLIPNTSASIIKRLKHELPLHK